MLKPSEVNVVKLHAAIAGLDTQFELDGKLKDFWEKHGESDPESLSISEKEIEKVCNVFGETIDALDEESVAELPAEVNEFYAELFAEELAAQEGEGGEGSGDGEKGEDKKPEETPPAKNEKKKPAKAPAKEEKAEKKEAPKKEKKPKEPKEDMRKGNPDLQKFRGAEKTRYGVSEGSGTSKIDALMEEGKYTKKEIADKVNTPESRIQTRIYVLKSQGHVIQAIPNQKKPDRKELKLTHKDDFKPGK